MPWRPLPRIAFAVATYPFAASSPADLPLELGDELYIIEQGGAAGEWYRGYLVAPPSLLSGLTSLRGQTLEARVFSGIFPRNCVEVREVLDDSIADELTTTTDFENGPTASKVSNDYYAATQTSPQHRKSVRRHGSKKKNVSRKSSITATDSAKDSGFGSFLSGSPSPRPLNMDDSQALSRKLSHRSVHSLRSQPSFVRLSPTPVQTLDRPPAPVPMLKIGDETPTSASEPLVDEIASCLREWHSKSLHEMLLSRRYSTLEQLAALARQLDISRRQLLHDILTSKELEKKREQAVWSLVRGNKLLGGEVIVRDPKRAGRLLTSDDSAIEMSKLQSTMSLLDQPPAIQSESTNLHHLMLELINIAECRLDAPALSVRLYSKIAGDRQHALTECFCIDIPSSDNVKQSTGPGKFKTLFSDLTLTDIGRAQGSATELYVVIEVLADQVVEHRSQDAPRKDSLLDVGSSPSSSRESLTPAPISMKRGRQSLMWAQKQLGSTRRRGAPSVPSVQANRAVNPTAVVQEKSSPKTPRTHQITAQEGNQRVKRVIAVAVLNITKLIAQGGSQEQQVVLWSPATHETLGPATKNAEKDPLVEELLPSFSGHYEQCTSLGYVCVALQSFSSPDAEELIIKTPTLLQGVSQTPKLGFSGAPKKARSDIYLTLSEAYLPVKALLSHPERGPEPLSSNTDYRDLQLTLEVRKKTGERVERCIFPNSNGPGLTAWRTVAVNRGQGWNQIIRLVLPEEDVHEAHLIMSIANAPGFTFALCWIPLWDQDAFIKDGLHQPLLYLYDKVTSSSEKGRGAYMALPWNSRAKDDSTKEEIFTGPVATLKLETTLCSTIFSQDRVLAGLLKWRDQSEEQLLALLRQFTFVPETDIVKVVNSLFDALFGILIGHAGKDEYEDLVFNAVVTILGIIHDRRFNLAPLIDRYTETRFDYPFATPCLIRSYLRLLARPADPQNSRRLHATFKVGQRMLKFITTARAKQKIKEHAIGVSNDLSFRRDYKNIFTAFESVMRDPSPILIGSKTLIVQYLHSWLPTGDDTFSEDEVYQIVSSFVGACSEVQGKLILYKLLLILHLSKRTCFAQETVQSRFAASTATWIGPYWGAHESPPDQWRNQIRVCCSIVSAQSAEFGVEMSSFFPNIVESYQVLLTTSRGRRQAQTFELLFPASHPFSSRPTSSVDLFDEPLVELAALLAQSSGAGLSRTLDDLGSAKERTISGALDMLSSILGSEAFPSSWLSLHVYHHRAALHVLETLHQAMTASFLPSPDDAEEFNTVLWNKYLVTLLRLVGSKSLALETFPEQKRRAVWKIAGDVRELGASLLRRSWEGIGWESSPDDQRRYDLQRIGGFQVQYVPSLVAPIVELCLSVHEGLRKVAVSILQTMIVSEWTLSEDLSVIEAEIIDCLDDTFKSKNIGEIITQKIFVTELLDLFESLARNPEDGLWQAIKSLVSTVDELLDLLASVHSPENSETVRIMHTLQLMDYLRDMQKEAIFIRYVHQLAEVQSSLQNHTEAGLALRLHASLYAWVPAPVAALTDPPFPEQTSFERKEQLYFEMIKQFEEGAAWDCALASYTELAEQYERYQYDFAKLARTQHSMARIYESIAKGERQSVRYFRVTYRGLGFPNNLRDKDFIFQGEAGEKQASFADRLRLQHPAAQVVSPGHDHNLEGQFLQIAHVTPHRDLGHPLYQLSKVPQPTREYILQSQPNRFSVTSRRHSPNTGVQDQWIEKTICETADSFPTILGKSEVVSIDTVQLSPLQTAVERTTRKTSEIAALQRRIIDGDESAFVGLTESIKTSVDWASLASVAQYRQLLPAAPEPTEEDEFIAEELVLEPMQNALKQALLDHASILRQCLTLYTHPPHVNLHKMLSESLQSTFAPEVALLAPTVLPSPPPTSYPPQSPSLPPSRGFSSDAVAPMIPLTNGITALPQPGAVDCEAVPIVRSRSRLSLSFLKPPARSNGSIDPEAPSSTLTPDEDSISSVSRPSAKNAAGQPFAMSDNPQARRPELERTHSRSSAGAAGESERPMTAQSGRSGGLKKRLSLLKGSVRSRAGGRGAVEVVEEE
ncbi:MAG: hypothetical protein LQ348_005758 [Seirophora lacunosa]|nr:MAG: hypothetical protein LQ348_005758 [Seirophora lacunosa]